MANAVQTNIIYFMTHTHTYIYIYEKLFMEREDKTLTAFFQCCVFNREPDYHTKLLNQQGNPDKTNFAFSNDQMIKDNNKP